MKLRFIIALLILAAEHWAFWSLAWGIRHREISESYRWLLTFWFFLPPLTAAVALAPWRYQIAAAASNGVLAAVLYRSVGFYQLPHIRDALPLNLMALFLLALIAATIGLYVRAITDKLDEFKESSFALRIWIAVKKSVLFALICACLGAPIPLIFGPGFPGMTGLLLKSIAIGVAGGLSFGLIVGFLVGFTYKSPQPKCKVVEEADPGR